MCIRRYGEFFCSPRCLSKIYGSVRGLELVRGEGLRGIKTLGDMVLWGKKKKIYFRAVTLFLFFFKSEQSSNRRASRKVASVPSDRCITRPRSWTDRRNSSLHPSSHNHHHHHLSGRSVFHRYCLKSQSSSLASLSPLLLLQLRSQVYMRFKESA